MAHGQETCLTFVALNPCFKVDTTITVTAINISITNRSISMQPAEQSQGDATCRATGLVPCCQKAYAYQQLLPHWSQMCCFLCKAAAHAAQLFSRHWLDGVQLVLCPAQQQQQRLLTSCHLSLRQAAASVVQHSHHPWVPWCCFFVCKAATAICKLSVNSCYPPVLLNVQALILKAATAACQHLRPRLVL